jgi:hypothetical protein
MEIDKSIVPLETSEAVLLIERLLLAVRRGHAGNRIVQECLAARLPDLGVFLFDAANDLKGHVLCIIPQPFLHTFATRTLYPVLRRVFDEHRDFQVYSRVCGQKIPPPVRLDIVFFHRESWKVQSDSPISIPQAHKHAIGRVGVSRGV